MSTKTKKRLRCGGVGTTCGTTTFTSTESSRHVGSGSRLPFAPLFFTSKNRTNNMSFHVLHDVEEPFIITTVKVGSTVLLIGVLCYILIILAINAYSPTRMDIVLHQERQGIVGKSDSATETNIHNRKSRPTQRHPFVVLSLALEQRFDPYGIAEQYFIDLERKILPHPKEDVTDFGSLHLFIAQADQLRNEFALRYGGENNARDMLQRGVHVVAATRLSKSSRNKQKLSDNKDGGLLLISSLIQRLQHVASENKGSFQILVTGTLEASSPTQSTTPSSFATTLEQLISAPFAAMGISLIIQNAAVENNFEFPGTWCLQNQMQQPEHRRNHVNSLPIDMILWDFATTTLQSFESYLRHVLLINSNSLQKDYPPPLLMLRVSSSSFTDEKYQTILQRYMDAGLLQYPMLIFPDYAAEPFLVLPESSRPVGFSSNSKHTGQIGNDPTLLSLLHHEELMAWLIAMRMLNALEYIAAYSIHPDHADLMLSKSSTNQKSLIPKSLPPQVALKSFQHDDPSMSLLVTGKADLDNKMWTLTPTQCRTTFDSPLSLSNLEILIVSGCSVCNNKDNPEFLLLPKSAMFYNAGWVLDLDLQLKREKRLRGRKDTDIQQNHIALVDTKKAFYGVYTSGTLTMFVPITKHNNKQPNPSNNEDPTSLRHQYRAVDYVESLVVCGFAITHRPDGCRLSQDLEFRVDGQRAPSSAISSFVIPNANNACVLVDIPSYARLITRSEAYDNNHTMTDEDLEQRNLRETVSGDNVIGLILDVQVHNERLTWDKGPCSVSHIVWQTKKLLP